MSRLVGGRRSRLVPTASHEYSFPGRKQTNPSLPARNPCYGIAVAAAPTSSFLRNKRCRCCCCCYCDDGTKTERHDTGRYDTERNGAQGSPDYSEYGYEPEFELQGDREQDPDADAATLAKWREAKLLENDRWQFGKYGTQNVGNWIGERQA